MTKPHETSPLFKADSATLSFYSSKDGKLSVSFQGYSDRKVVLPGEVFEVRWGEQGCEGRIRPGGAASRGQNWPRPQILTLPPQIWGPPGVRPC
jgi:hypothetical protein